MEHPTFYSKTAEYQTCMIELEKEQKYTEAIEILKEELSFLDGVILASEGDVMWHNYYSNYRNIIRLLQRAMETNKRIYEVEDKYNIRCNQIQEQVTKIKETLDDIYSNK